MLVSSAVGVMEGLLEQFRHRFSRPQFRNFSTYILGLVACEGRKNVSTHLEEWIKKADLASYSAKITELKAARKTLADAMKPFNEKKAPLAKAWKYCVNVAFPDSLKELGASVAPRFSLSDWIAEATKLKKK